MQLYEFITPSDPITFRAEDDMVAYMATVLLSEGKAGCAREDGDSLPTFVAFTKDPDAQLVGYIGEGVGEWLLKNRERLAECYDTFQYTTVAGRAIYEQELEQQSERSQRELFKTMWEEERRSSMTKWVLYAWALGQTLHKKQPA